MWVAVYMEEDEIGRDLHCPGPSGSQVCHYPLIPRFSSSIYLERETETGRSSFAWERRDGGRVYETEIFKQLWSKASKFPKHGTWTAASVTCEVVRKEHLQAPTQTCEISNYGGEVQQSAS